MTQILGAFLATGIFQLRRHNNVGWRHLIEGGFYVFAWLMCGLVSFALMPAARLKLKHGFVRTVGSQNGEQALVCHMCAF